MYLTIKLTLSVIHSTKLCANQKVFRCVCMRAAIWFAYNITFIKLDGFFTSANPRLHKFHYPVSVVFMHTTAIVVNRHFIFPCLHAKWQFTTMDAWKVNGFETVVFLRCCKICAYHYISCLETDSCIHNAASVITMDIHMHLIDLF